MYRMFGVNCVFVIVKSNEGTVNLSYSIKLFIKCPAWKLNFKLLIKYFVSYMKSWFLTYCVGLLILKSSLRSKSVDVNWSTVYPEGSPCEWAASPFVSLFNW